MALVIALGLIAVLAIIMTIFVGYERGPAPADVAVAYELAWHRRDYSTMFDLSAKELRDGLARDEFVAAKRASDAKIDRAPSNPLSRGVSKGAPNRVTVDEVVAATDSALVITRLADLRHRVLCERRQGRWQVVGYNLVTNGS
jgi:hypothetical protein